MNNTYWIFSLMAVCTVASPGPGVLMTLDNAIAHGWKAAMHGVLGLAIGAAAMAGLSSAGIGLLVRSSPLLLLLMKYCGVGYLFFLAWKTWIRAPAPFGAAPGGMAPRGSGHGGRMLRGALLQASNPNVLLFFLSVLPQFAAGGDASAPRGTALAAAIAIYCLALIAIHGLYAGLAASARTWLGQAHVARALSRLGASVFIAFGVSMLTLKL